METMMSREMKLSALLVASLACVWTASASAEEKVGKAADNAIYAQTLVNATVAQHPELIIVGMHALKPGAKIETMIAANIDRIGKKDDEDDLAVAHEKKTILAPNMKDPTKFEVALPLKDASGKVIGSPSPVVKYTAGAHEA